MGVSQALTRMAVRRVHVMVVEVSGWWTARAAFERRLSARNWRVALSPADADVLAVCGRPGPQMAKVIDRMWDQMPGPRVRVEIDSAQAVDVALDRVTAGLLDVASQQDDARRRAQEPDVSDGNAQEDSGHGDDHNSMDHGQMGMAPAGIALAEGGQDRDGLEMDVLHVRLGPVLPYWPPGLVVRCALHGDAIAGSEAWIVDAVPREASAVGGGASPAARRCDQITDVLALAGWQRAAATARRARDLVLTQPDTEPAAAALHGLQRTLRRSRLLRWSLRGLGPLTAEDVKRAQLPLAFVGDTYDRLLARLDSAAQDASNSLAGNSLDVGASQAIGVIPDIVRGLDVGAARLVIAGLGIDTAESTLEVSVRD